VCIDIRAQSEAAPIFKGNELFPKPQILCPFACWPSCSLPMFVASVLPISGQQSFDVSLPTHDEYIRSDKSCSSSSSSPLMSSPSHQKSSVIFEPVLAPSLQRSYSPPRSGASSEHTTSNSSASSPSPTPSTTSTVSTPGEVPDQTLTHPVNSFPAKTPVFAGEERGLSYDDDDRFLLFFLWRLCNLQFCFMLRANLTHDIYSQRCFRFIIISRKRDDQV